MSDIRAISELTSIDSVRTKRAYRRGQITKIKPRLEALQHQPLRECKQSDFQDLQQELAREIELHEALQLQLETLLRSKVGEDDAYNEECAGEELKKQHSRLIQNIRLLSNRHQHYKVAVTLQKELVKLNGIPNITTRAFETTFSKISDKVATFLEDTQDFSDDDQLGDIRDTLEAEVARILTQMTESQAAEKERPAPVVPSHKEQTKFDLTLPSFSGKPTDWTNFFELFDSTLKTRGKHLNDMEKRCLLLKAMSTEEAKKTVRIHAKGDDGYDKAVEALIRDYGSPNILYPHHMRELVTDETYTYTRDGIKRFREHYHLNYLALKELKGDTLSQFLAAHAFSNFDNKLREEWTKHHAAKSTLPTLEDMLEYFSPLEHSMSQVETHSPTLPKSHAVQSNGKPKRQATSAKAPVTASSKSLCPICKEPHSLTRCAVFQSYELDRRHKIVKDNKCCTNCLHPSHTQSKCTSPFSCRHC